MLHATGWLHLHLHLHPQYCLSYGTHAPSKFDLDALACVRVRSAVTKERQAFMQLLQKEADRVNSALALAGKGACKWSRPQALLFPGMLQAFMQIFVKADHILAVLDWAPGHQMLSA